MLEGYQGRKDQGGKQGRAKKVQLRSKRYPPLQNLPLPGPGPPSFFPTDACSVFEMEAQRTNSQPDKAEKEAGDDAERVLKHCVIPFLTKRREQRRGVIAHSVTASFAAGGMFDLAVVPSHDFDTSENIEVAIWAFDRRLYDRIAGNFRAVAAGVQHWLALKHDGSIEIYENPPWERRNIPAKLVEGDFVSVAAGDAHSLALRRDGGIACWGNNDHGQAPPGGVDGDFVAIAGGWKHSLALRRDGSVACWGSNEYGQAPPAGVDGDFVAIAAGSEHSLALRTDGNVACWGDNGEGQAPPAGVDGDFRAIAAGLNYSLARFRDGSVRRWGNDAYLRYELR